MKIGIRKGVGLVMALTAAITLGMAGCSSGGGDSAAPAGGTATSANLKGALYSTLSTAPVVSSTLSRQTLTAIVGATVNYVQDVTGVAGFGAGKILVGSATTNASGVASFAAPAGSYTARLSGTPNDLVAGENAAYFSSETVSSSGGKAYQADQYAFPITSAISMSNVTVQVYQTDSAGTVDWGSYTTAVNPWALTAAASTRNPIVYSKSAAPATTTTDTQNVELFKGYYRVVITATPTTVTDSIATYIGPVITVAGGGATVSTPVTLVAPSKAPSVTLQDTAGAVLAGFTVDFFESTNKIRIGTATTNASGVASIGAPSGTTGVIAKIYDTTAAYKGVYAFSDINTTSAATLKQFTVDGLVQPNAGSLDATDALTVYALTNSGLGRWADNATVALVAATPGTGVYQLTLFGGTAGAQNYKLGAISVKGYPDVTKTSIALNNAALTGQNIAVAPGGLILGKIQTEGKTDIAGVTVSVYGTSADGIIDLVNAGVTNATGDYSIEVPYGTYFLLVNGAVTDGIVISAGAVTTQKNLTQFAMTGQVSKNLGSTTSGANAASVLIGFQTATTSSLGVYTINVMEGKNWVCMAPSAVNDPTYGAACTLSVLVNKDTVAAARL